MADILQHYISYKSKSFHVKHLRIITIFLQCIDYSIRFINWFNIFYSIITNYI